VSTVSAVIPCYNGERFVADAIESVLKQTFTDIELIVVDDGSTDDSRSVTNSYTADARVKHIEHRDNRGIAAARNTGIRNASGDYIAFLDQDDLWVRNKIEKQVSAIEGDESIGLIYTAMETRRLGGTRLPADRKRTPDGINNASTEELIEALYLYNFIPLASVLVRRQCFDEVGFLDEAIRSGVDDYEFVTRVVQKYRAWFLDERLFIRREHATNFTNEFKMAPDVIAINRRLAESYPRLAALQNERESYLLFRMGRALQMAGRRTEARTAYRQSLDTRPGWPPPRVALMLLHMGSVGDAIIDAWNRLKIRLGG